MDDNEDILEIVKEVLKYEKFEVEAIEDANAFMNNAKAFRPHLVLLDYKLKDGNGGELCRAFKAEPEFINVPVIIFSAYTHPGMDLGNYDSDAVIAKPFDLEVLTDSIPKLLSKSENA